MLTKFIHDTHLTYMRTMRGTLRNPIFVIFGLFNPLCFLLLFAPLLESLSKAPGFPAGSALATFVPGLLIMIALYGSSFVGFGLLEDVRHGVLERFKVTPISRTALLVGMVLRDVTVLFVQSLLLIALAVLFFGVRINIIGTCGTFAIVGLIGFGLASFSYAVALAVGSEDALAATINFFIVPTQLLAGITLPLTLAPVWLQRVAFVNPLSHAVTAARMLCAGKLYETGVMGGFIAATLLALVLGTWGIRSLKK